MAIRERYRRVRPDRKAGFSRRERGFTTRDLNLRDMGLILREDPYDSDGKINDRCLNITTGDIFIKTSQGWQLMAHAGAMSGNAGKIRGGRARDYGLFGVAAFWGADENIFAKTEHRYWQWNELPQALLYALEKVVAFVGANNEVFYRVGDRYFQWDSLTNFIDYMLRGTVAFAGQNNDRFYVSDGQYFQW